MTNETDLESAPQRTLFLARLALGAAQGLVLYLLYRATDAHVWPATEPTSFAPQLLTALYVPLLVSQAMGTMRLRTLLIWALVAAIACCGLATYDRLNHPVTGTLGPDDLLPQAALFFFGFAGLFIAQSLIAGGDAERKYIAGYAVYFDAAWKLGVQLAFSAVFTVVFWAVLWLGAALFDLIKLDFLEKLIRHDWFAIPASALAVAAAIHLTDVRAKLVAGIRGLMLTLLGWLLPLMALIAAGFLIGLVFTGFAPLWQTKSAAAGLLGAAAALVILINAAYQNGEDESVRPTLLRIAEIVASFTLVPLVLIAAYALSLRVGQYGWTIDRVVTLACVVVALCYAVGYAAAAILSLLGRPWMQALQPVNIATSFVVVVLLLALFTPVADPMKLSVDSQIARLRDGRTSATAFDYDYLKRQTGRFGLRALQNLSKSKDAVIARRAQYALTTGGALPGPPPAPADLATNITVWPKGKTLPSSLLKQNWRAAKTEMTVPDCLLTPGARCEAMLADMNGDGVEEAIIINGGKLYWWGTVLQQTASGWTIAGTLPSPHCNGDLEALRAGKFTMTPPKNPAWNMLQIKGRDVPFLPANPALNVTCPR